MDRCARFHSLLDERFQALGRSVQDLTQSNPSDFPAVFLRCDHHQRFTLQIASPLAYGDDKWLGGAFLTRFLMEFGLGRLAMKRWSARGTYSGVR